jgi:hypothetical protein
MCWRIPRTCLIPPVCRLVVRFFGWDGWWALYDLMIGALLAEGASLSLYSMRGLRSGLSTTNV